MLNDEDSTRLRAWIDRTMTVKRGREPVSRISIVQGRTRGSARQMCPAVPIDEEITADEVYAELHGLVGELIPTAEQPRIFLVPYQFGGTTPAGPHFEVRVPEEVLEETQSVRAELAVRGQRSAELAQVLDVSRGFLADARDHNLKLQEQIAAMYPQFLELSIHAVRLQHDRDMWEHEAQAAGRSKMLEEVMPLLEQVAPTMAAGAAAYMAGQAAGKPVPADPGAAFDHYQTAMQQAVVAFGAHIQAHPETMTPERHDALSAWLLETVRTAQAWQPSAAPAESSAAPAES